MYIFQPYEPISLSEPYIYNIDRYFVDKHSISNLFISDSYDGIYARVNIDNIINVLLTNNIKFQNPTNEYILLDLLSIYTNLLNKKE